MFTMTLLRYWNSYDIIALLEQYFFIMFKVAATDMRYFARSKLFGSLVHKENFGLI